MRLTGMLLAFAFLFVPAEAVKAQPSSFDQHAASAEHLREAVLSKLTVWTNPNTGERTYVFHCREAVSGCEERIDTLVSWIVEASQRYNFDPVLATAVAWHESRFDPFTIGQVGEAGIFQIHPHAPWADGLKFVKRKWYRRQCRNKPGACQEQVIDTAVSLLRNCVDQCQSTPRGLGLYNTGECGGNRSYTRKVLRVRKELQDRLDYFQSHTDALRSGDTKQCLYRTYCIAN